MSTRTLYLAAAVLTACVTPKKRIVATSTIEESPLEAAPAAAAAASPTPEPAAPSASVELKRFEEAEGFSVELPPTAKVTRETKPSPLGSIEIVKASAEAGEVSFSFVRIAYPKTLASYLKVDNLADQMSRGVAKELKGSVVEEKPVTAPGGTGKDFKVAGEQRMCVGRVLLGGTVQYTLNAFYKGAPPEAAARFIASLRVTPEAP
jgi:hypothetical protein